MFVDNIITAIGPPGQIEELSGQWVGLRLRGSNRHPNTETVEAVYSSQTEWKPGIDIVLEGAEQFLAIDLQLEWASTLIPEWNGLLQVRQCEVYVAVDQGLEDIRYLANIFTVKQKGFWECLEALKEEHGRSTSS